MKKSDKVVCVDDSMWPSNPERSCTEEYRHPNGNVKKGDIYVIAGHITDSWGVIGLLIIGKPVYHKGFTCGWHQKRFRLLSEIREEQAALIGDCIGVTTEREEIE